MLNNDHDSSRSRNLEFALYALALGLALFVRLLRLGAWPLTDEEARWAMQAFEIAHGLRPEIGSQPLYVLLTALAFFVAQSSEYAARLAPALFGAALVVTPYFFRDRLGEKAALVLAFLLAFEPGLLALSRLAGSPIMAVSAAMLAWGLWRTGQARAAGVLTGLALLGGPHLWPGVLGLVVAYGLARGFLTQLDESQPLDRPALTQAAIYAGGTFFVVGSFFLLVPGGLGGGVRALVEYFGGWLDFTDVPAWRLLLALNVYQFPALLLGLAALVRGLFQRDELVQRLGLWLLAALILALANPYRQVMDLAWALLPLWSLAALEVVRHLRPIEDGLWETLGMLAFTLSVLVFVGMNFVNLALVPLDAANLQLRWVILAASLVLLALSILMVAYGWSVSVAVQGSVWGVLLTLAVYLLATGMAAGGLRTYETIELWSPGLYVRQAPTLASQLENVSSWRLTPERPLDVAVTGLDLPSMRWALRNREATFGEVIRGTPSVIIAGSQVETSELQAGYRGQDLIWRAAPDWNQVPAADWLRWILTHRLPEAQESIILWVRSDLFIDTQGTNP